MTQIIPDIINIVIEAIFAILGLFFTGVAVQMLEAKGIKVTAEVKAMIEAAVKELDIAVDSTIGTLGGIFVEDNPGKTDGEKELNN